MQDGIIILAEVTGCRLEGTPDTVELDCRMSRGKWARDHRDREYMAYVCDWYETARHAVLCLRMMSSDDAESALIIMTKGRATTYLTRSALSQMARRRTA